MSLLAKLTVYMPNDPILSADANAAENQVLNALNGTSTNKNILIRYTDAATPPLDLDQLGAGLLARWKNAGVPVATVTNGGSFSTTQQFISSLAIGTKPIDVTSTTLCTNLNADLVDGLQGSQLLRNDQNGSLTGDLAVSGALTVSGDFNISSANPKLTLTDTTGGDDDFELSANGDTLTLQVSGGSNIATVAGGTQVLTFAQIPVGPSSNPTTGDQLTRKTYVDSKTTAWSASWPYYAVPSAVETTESVGRFICPEGTTIKITKIQAVFAGGSHTSGASLIWTLKRRNSAGSAQSDLGTITFDNTNGTKDTLYSNDIGDVTLSSGDQIYPLLTTRSGTITESIATICVIGVQTVT